MNQANGKKRREGTAGVKALIASASVAATIAGWALLPSNDPTPTSAAPNPSPEQPALGVPGSGDNNPSLSSPGAQDPQAPSFTEPDPSLPQVQPNGGFFPQPFTRTHSSR